MTLTGGTQNSGRHGKLRCLLFAVWLFAPSSARGQDPSHDYLTIATTHFRVTFTKPLEPFARRVAADAERAYGQLSNELHPPRGIIDILVTDDFDFSNGSATPYPSNRIIVYATPPVGELGLRFNTDWAQLVITHELTHIFHLDRTRGIWRLGQFIFGRSPFLFPNLYAPSWLIEGLAVHEESKQTGEGRIEAPENTMLIRTAAVYDQFPRIGQASLALPTFPQGNSAYAYGSLFVDYLANSAGDSSVRKFVESESGQLIPYLIDIPAKRAFGTTFTKAWGEWQKSVEASLPPGKPAADGWRDLTTDGLAAASPRWVGDSSVTYTGNGGKDVFGEFAVSLAGTRQRLAQRNSASPTVPLPDGSSLFSQLELTSLYDERSDLFIQRGDDQTRLPTNQRLFTPDARADGAIVAEQIVEGGSRLVRVSLANGAVTPITSAGLDTLWSEPRWSHKGDRIAAVRWFRGGVSQIVVIDTLGNVLHVATSGLFTAASPSWFPGDSGIAYTVGDNARNDVYLQYFGAPSLPTVTYKINRSDFGAFEPQLTTDRANNREMMTAVDLRANGYRIDVSDQLSRAAQSPTMETAPDPHLPALAIDTTPAATYSALRTLVPRYWVPMLESSLGANAYRIGGYTEGWDILRRHYIYAELLFPTDNTGVVGSAEYDYRGLGQPILSFDATQDWAHYANVFSNDSARTFLGQVRRRVRTGQALATFERQRVRSAFTLSVGVTAERREYVTLPDSLMKGINGTNDFVAADFPGVILSSSYAAYKTAPFSISPEDGGTVAFTVRERTRSGFSGTGGPSTSIVGTASTFTSLDLPGYAHHVLALRGSAGWADTRAAGYFDVGGISGGTFQVIPGYTVGEGRQTFPVRGFEPGTLIGIRALTGSAEYRMPLWLNHESIGLIPAFLNRSSLTLFSDYGMAWCPNTVTTRLVCSDTTLERRYDLASVGAEFNVNAGLLSWDSPYRFRFGFALPVQNGAAFGAKKFSLYVTSGVSF